MKERGQVFTLDMFLALTLAALIVSYSGLAFEQVTKRGEDFTLRYSIERAANDAADVLVKTAGRPPNWEENIANLETPGLALTQNSFSIKKFEALRCLCASENWDNMTNATQAVRPLFNNSEKFEIWLIDESTGENMWPPVYPRWDVETTSGVENSLEVVVAKRLVTMEEVNVRGEIKGILHKKEPLTYYIEFTVRPGELDNRDWYIVIKPAEPGKPTFSIWVNHDPDDDPDYHYPEMSPPYKPRYHGEDDNILYPLHEGPNYLWVRVTGKEGSADLFVVALQRCSPFSWAELLEFGTLEVKLWR